MTIDPAHAESRRREVVANLAARGTLSQRAANEGVEASNEAADAAYQQFEDALQAARPDAWQAEIGARTDAMRQAGEAASADTQGVFHRSRERQLGAEMQRYDRMPIYAEALNTQLGRYEKGLQDDAAARAAAAASYRSRGGSSNSFTPRLNTGDTEPSGVNRGMVFEVLGPATAQIIEDSIAAGASYADAAAAMEATLIANGVPQDALDDWMAGFEGSWNAANESANPDPDRSAHWRSERWR